MINKSSAAANYEKWTAGVNGGRDRDRTCDPYRVKVVLSR